MLRQNSPKIHEEFTLLFQIASKKGALVSILSKVGKKTSLKWFLQACFL